MKMLDTFTAEILNPHARLCHRGRLLSIFDGSKCRHSQNELRSLMCESILSSLRPQYDQLHNDYLKLLARWKMYEQLYVTDPSAVDVLNKIAPAYFGFTQEAQIEDVLNGITRITDCVGTTKRPNLVIQRLLDGVQGESNFAAIAKRMSDAIAALDPIRIQILSVRNKRLAHRDFNQAMTPGDNPLPGITYAMIITVLIEIGSFLNIFREADQGEPTDYKSAIFPPGQGTSLIFALRRYLELRQQERDKNISENG